MGNYIRKEPLTIDEIYGIERHPVYSSTLPSKDLIQRVNGSPHYPSQSSTIASDSSYPMIIFRRRSSANVSTLEKDGKKPTRDSLRAQNEEDAGRKSLTSQHQSQFNLTRSDEVDISIPQIKNSIRENPSQLNSLRMEPRKNETTLKVPVSTFNSSPLFSDKMTISVGQSSSSPSHRDTSIYSSEVHQSKSLMSKEVARSKQDVSIEVSVGKQKINKSLQVGHTSLPRNVETSPSSFPSRKRRQRRRIVRNHSINTSEENLQTLTVAYEIHNSPHKRRNNQPFVGSTPIRSTSLYSPSSETVSVESCGQFQNNNLLLKQRTLQCDSSQKDEETPSRDYKIEENPTSIEEESSRRKPAINEQSRKTRDHNITLDGPRDEIRPLEIVKTPQAEIDSEMEGFPISSPTSFLQETISDNHINEGGSSSPNVLDDADEAMEMVVPTTCKPLTIIRKARDDYQTQETTAQETLELRRPSKDTLTANFLVDYVITHVIEGHDQTKHIDCIPQVRIWSSSSQSDDNSDSCLDQADDSQRSNHSSISTTFTGTSLLSLDKGSENHDEIRHFGKHKTKGKFINAVHPNTKSSDVHSNLCRTFNPPGIHLECACSCDSINTFNSTPKLRQKHKLGATESTNITKHQSIKDADSHSGESGEEKDPFLFFVENELSSVKPDNTISSPVCVEISGN